MRTAKNAEISGLVKEAIKSYPGGLCFSEPGGKPILVNRTMNHLIYTLTGHTVINADSTWDEINNIQEQNGCIRLDPPDAYISNDAAEASTLIFRFSSLDDKIWKISRQVLYADNLSAVQLEAVEITELYRISKELYDNNQKMDALRIRQKALLEDIVNINRKKELLATKMRIHDDFGRCLVASQKLLGTQDISQHEFKQLISSWSDAIHGMQNFDEQRTDSAEPELLKVAELIGCKLSFVGEKPIKRKSRLLMYSAVREALTNAVRHGGASVINVNCTKCSGICRIEISNNGKPPQGLPVEHGGLKSLRHSLEQEGASLEYRLCDTFALVIKIPENDLEA